MTKLEAVNEMLRACQYAPVAALDTGGDSEEAYAEVELDSATIRVQNVGWTENTRFAVAFDPDGVTSKIEVAADTYLRATNSEWKGPRITVTVREGYLYDLDDNTDEFDDTMYLDVVDLLDFTDCSPELQRLIVAQASVDYYLSQIGRGDMYPVLEKKLADARAAMQRQECDVSGASLRNRRLVQQSQGLRPGPWRH